MMKAKLMVGFEGVDATKRPDIHSFTQVREQILWVLATGKNCVGVDFLTTAQVSDVLRDVYQIAVSRQRVSSILDKEKGTVVRRRVNGVLQYKVMKKGEDEVLSSAVAPVFIEPEAALSQIRRVEDLFSALRGDLKICDPYVDNRTLDLLAECKTAKQISVLTSNVYREGRFRRDLAAFEKGYGTALETRVLEHGDLHDRYIIHAEGMLLLGTSLNGLGKKQSFVVSLGQDLRRIVSAAFDRSWNSAKKFA